MDVLGYLFAEDWVEGQERQSPDPVLLGGRMGALYRDWTGPAGIDLVAITAGFLDRLECRTPPIGQTCLHAAAAVARWGGPPYHSLCHHAEVATNAMVITEMLPFFGEAMPPARRALLLAGCLAHDIYYDPQAGTRPTFTAEIESARALEAIARQCGLPEPEQAMLTVLILATEPGFRPVLARLLEGGGTADLPAGLEALLAQPPLAALAAVLSDADLLSSAGLSEEWHAVQVERLQHETGQPIRPEDDFRFLETVVGANFLTAGARLFSPNLIRIRAAVARARAAHEA